MPAVELLPGLRYQVKKDDFGNTELFEIKKRLFADNIEVLNLSTGITHTIHEPEIVEKLFAGTLQLEVSGKNTREPAQGRLRTEFSWQDISELKPKRQVVAAGRYLILTEFLKLTATMSEKDAHPIAVKKGRAQLEQRLKEIVNDPSPDIKEDVRKEMALILLKLEEVFPAPKLSTVRLWRTDFLRTGRDIRSLVPQLDNCGAPKKTRRSNRLDDLIRQAFEIVHMKPERGSITQAHEELGGLIKRENDFVRRGSPPARVPSLRSLYDWIERQDDREVLRRRFGRKMANNAYRSTGEGVRTTHPLERAEYDDTMLPIFLIDDMDGMPIGKACLTFGLDHNTAYPLGLHLSFHSPSKATVGECLRHSIEPKTYVAKMYKSIKRTWDAYGAPYTVAVDLGKGYQAWLIENACRQLVSDIVDCPVRTPHFKGRIERFFRTIKEILLKGLPGVTFDDIFDRHDYDPQKHAVLTLNMFLELLHIFTIEIYAQDWHDGVGGVPQQLWDEGIKKVPRRYPPSAAEMRLLVSHTEYRMLHHYGFDIWKIKYNDPDNIELAKLRRLAEKASSEEEKKFKIKVYLWDLSRIWVYDHFNGRYISVPAVDQEYTANLSYYKHRIVLKEIKRRKIEQVDQDALREARRKITAIVAKEFTAARKMRTRKRLACFLGKSDPICPPDIEFEEPIEEHIMDPCTAPTFEGISDFTPTQEAKSTKSPGAGREHSKEDIKVPLAKTNEGPPQPDTFDPKGRRATYSRARIVR
ncbi:MAG: hypothetical protein M0024_04020 [Nitrospiraceae bacterium]|nr:hypothetical protein [Nitrospiraceae bacterium]